MAGRGNHLATNNPNMAGDSANKKPATSTMPSVWGFLHALQAVAMIGLYVQVNQQPLNTDPSITVSEDPKWVYPKALWILARCPPLCTAPAAYAAPPSKELAGCGTGGRRRAPCNVPARRLGRRFHAAGVSRM